MKEVETLATSRKKRTARTKHNILHVKRTIENKYENTLKGTFIRHHIRAFIVTDVCGECKNRNKRIRLMQVISKSHLNGETRVTSEINAYGMLQFHYDIPMTLTDEIKHIPCCFDCAKARASEGETVETSVNKGS